MLQEVGYLKVAYLSHIRYHGVLLWNKMEVDWLSVAMWFGTCSCLGARMCTHSLVPPLFEVKPKWFGIPNFCNVEEEWEGHGEVCDSNDVKVGFRLVEGLVQDIKSPFFPRECACWEVWAGWERVA